MVGKLAFGILASLHQAGSGLQQLPLGLVFTPPNPHRLVMPLEHLAQLIHIIPLQCIHCLVEAGALFKGEGISNAKIFNLLADCRQI